MDPGATASGMQTATIKTMIRCRPLPPGKKPVVDADAARQGTLSINHPTRNVEQEFEFDGLFPGETSQEKVCPPIRSGHPAPIPCDGGIAAPKFVWWPSKCADTSAGAAGV